MSPRELAEVRKVYFSEANRMMKTIGAEHPAAAALAARFNAAGLPCEIEAGPAGLVVYAASSAVVTCVTLNIANALRDRRLRPVVSAPAFERDEPAATCWWASVDFDWSKLS